MRKNWISSSFIHVCKCHFAFIPLFYDAKIRMVVTLHPVRMGQPALINCIMATYVSVQTSGLAKTAQVFVRNIVDSAFCGDDRAT